MKFVLIYTLALFVIFTGCNEKAPTKTSNLNKNVVIEKATNMEDHSRTMGKGDYNFQIKNMPRQDSVRLEVLYKGKLIETFGYSGVVRGETIADINADNNPELYLSVTDKNNNVTLKALTFINGSVMDIYKQEYTTTVINNTTSFKVNNKQLVETKNNKEMLRYNLIAGESSFILKPEGWGNAELSSMKGKYISYDVDKKIDKVLDLMSNEYGEWVVKLKSMDRSCEFIGVGYFYNKDLIVPLNYKKADLKGKLKINFVSNQAVVYVVDSKNSSELTDFCKSGGSIAGNFIKK
ncbi:MAG: hypothetical protein V3V14_07975 [Saprospiraceae bacterium]